MDITSTSVLYIMTKEGQIEMVELTYIALYGKGLLIPKFITVGVSIPTIMKFGVTWTLVFQ